MSPPNVNVAAVSPCALPVSAVRESQKPSSGVELPPAAMSDFQNGSAFVSLVPANANPRIPETALGKSSVRSVI